MRNALARLLARVQIGRTVRKEIVQYKYFLGIS